MDRVGRRVTPGRIPGSRVRPDRPCDRFAPVPVPAPGCGRRTLSAGVNPLPVSPGLYAASEIRRSAMTDVPVGAGTRPGDRHRPGCSTGPDSAPARRLVRFRAPVPGRRSGEPDSAHTARRDPSRTRPDHRRAHRAVRRSPPRQLATSPPAPGGTQTSDDHPDANHNRIGCERGPDHGECPQDVPGRSRLVIC